ncbi:hypothetical protein XU18_2245 [Perkinsela sp. CCAP 1560/4]|nr:hypothetical protein XU18_2245 [Perkinsela sp. CCAP 1560/4]|eukprot:KNH06974.1 hypothetical protein XU18_2245 [Perkinsela sp. CCAP 1560/4]
MSKPIFTRITYGLISLLLIVLAIQTVSNFQSSRLIVDVRVPIPTVDDLQQSYGIDRNLTSGDVRALYHKIITEVGQKWERDVIQHNCKSMATDDPSDHIDDSLDNSHVIIPRKVVRIVPGNTVARGCNLLRHRIRLYCRSRDAEVSPVMLSLRDAWVHGVLGMFGDASSPDSFLRGLTVELPSCLANGEDRPCPSYDTLRNVKGKRDDEIIDSSWRSNPWYDKYENNNKRE